jgi:hypothetical protein
VHVRGIVITCDVLIQSERVNTILKYREYRATSTVTEPIKYGFLPPTSISARSGELLPAVSFKLASYNVGNKTHRRFQYLIGASSQF